MCKVQWVTSKGITIPGTISPSVRLSFLQLPASLNFWQHSTCFTVFKPPAWAPSRVHIKTNPWARCEQCISTTEAFVWFNSLIHDSCFRSSQPKQLPVCHQEEKSSWKQNSCLSCLYRGVKPWEISVDSLISFFYYYWFIWGWDPTAQINWGRQPEKMLEKKV